MTKLRLMTEPEFAGFLERSIPEYATEKVKAGTWSVEDSLRLSKESHEKLLPQGLSTPDNYLFTIEHDGDVAGNLWMAVQHPAGRPIGFIFDLFVAASFRRQGIATDAMRLLEDEASRLGLHTLSLHVFGFNAAARALYEQAGYVITDIDMSKSLSAPRLRLEETKGKGKS